MTLHASCTVGSAFTDPASGACINASDPSSLSCALGSCQLCPRGALCPGGARAWSRPGWFLPAESVFTPLECSPPGAASERCVGWDVARGVTLCGPTYRYASLPSYPSPLFQPDPKPTTVHTNLHCMCLPPFVSPCVSPQTRVLDVRELRRW
jgi:hypothetical protein